MSLFCPECKGMFLRITQTIELPQDGDFDEISLQVVCCSSCDFHALAAYKESRRGALDQEVVIHEAYRVSQPDLERVGKLISKCTSPRKQDCRCSSHQTLSRRTGFRWDALAHLGVKIQKVFVL